MSVIPSPEIRFKDNILAMLDFMKSLISESVQKGFDFDEKLFDVVTELLDNEPEPKNIVRGFIKRSVKHWDEVRKRDINFFANNAMLIFGEVPEETVNLMSGLFTTIDRNGNRYYVSNNDEIELFEICSDLICTTISYIHNNKYELVMLHEFLPVGFNYVNEAEKWGVKLS